MMTGAVGRWTADQICTVHILGCLMIFSLSLCFHSLLPCAIRLCEQRELFLVSSYSPLAAGVELLVLGQIHTLRFGKGSL